MREHRDQLALVCLASVSHHKNTSFRLWTRLTPGRGPILSHRDQSLGNWCWISSWGKQMKTHSIKLALKSSLYFKVGRSRNLSSWPRWGCFPCLSLSCGCSHPMHKTQHREWCCTDIPCATAGRNSHWDYSHSAALQHSARLPSQGCPAHSQLGADLPQQVVLSPPLEHEMFFSPTSVTPAGRWLL